MKKPYKISYGILTFLLASNTILSKVLIFTWVYNRPDFIELHDKTFKFFLEDAYEYIVFNDAPNDTMKKLIEQTCQRLNILCVRVSQSLHAQFGNEPGRRHSDGIQFAFEQYGFDHDGIILMIDADAFLIKPFSAEKYLNGYDLIGSIQIRMGSKKIVEYIVPTVALLDMKTLPNKRNLSFHGGSVEGARCDTGGLTHYYMQNNPTARIKLCWAESCDNEPKKPQLLDAMGYDACAINYILTYRRYCFEFHLDKNFNHYNAGGSNWCGCSEEVLRERTQSLNNFIDQSIEYYKQRGYVSAH